MQSKSVKVNIFGRLYEVKNYEFYSRHLEKVQEELKKVCEATNYKDKNFYGKKFDNYVLVALRKVFIENNKLAPINILEIDFGLETKLEKIVECYKKMGFKFDRNKCAELYGNFFAEYFGLSADEKEKLIGMLSEENLEEKARSTIKKALCEFFKIPETYPLQDVLEKIQEKQKEQNI
ncbi:MAG: hypothetical protein ACP5JY_00645 [Candidatus Nanoarchaeia archaeon]